MSFIALKYGLLENEPTSLFNLGTLSSGKYSLRLTPLETDNIQSSSEEEEDDGEEVEQQDEQEDSEEN